MDVVNIPKQYKGWGVVLDRNKYYRICKQINGERIVKHIGKTWYPEIADRFIKKIENDPQYKKINRVFITTTPQYKGWTVAFYQNKYHCIRKRINGRVYHRYIGKEWNQYKADLAIAKVEKSIKQICPTQN